MKNKKIFLAILVTALVFGMTTCGEVVIGAGDDHENIIMPETSGRLTITGLDDYNGMYIYCSDYDSGGGWIAANGAKDTPSSDGYSIVVNQVQISDGKAVLKVWKVVGNYTSGHKFENFTESYPEDGHSILYMRQDIYSTERPYGNKLVASGRLNPTPRFVDGIGTAHFVAN